MKIQMSFDNYSEDALTQVVEQAPGKHVFHNYEGMVAGEIKGAKRIGETHIIEFEVDMEEMN